MKLLNWSGDSLANAEQGQKPNDGCETIWPKEKTEELTFPKLERLRHQSEMRRARFQGKPSEKTRDIHAVETALHLLVFWAQTRRILYAIRSL